MAVLSENAWKKARDQYVVRESKLPTEFTWAKKVRVPSQLGKSDCARAVGRLAMKVQGIKYPVKSELTKVLPTGRTGLDMRMLVSGLNCLGVECEELPNSTANSIFELLASDPLQVVIFCHQMLAGTYGQYRRCMSGHYATAVFADKCQGDIYY